MTRTKTRRQFECYDCGEVKRIEVDGATQRRSVARREGRVMKTVAHCECKKCGNEWWSSHPDAIKLARERDANRNRRHGRTAGSDE